ncbi:MAG: hypothetical protein WC755_03085 [Candidatus Woesearchaeota archaeon]|jgi:hypothetical protein
MRKWGSKTVFVFLLLLASLMPFVLSQSINDSGVYAASDKDYYNCYPSCIAEIEFTNTNDTLAASLFNITIINTYGQGSMNYTIINYTGLNSYNFSQITENISRVDYFNISLGVTHTFYVRIQMFNPVVTKWNITFSVVPSFVAVMTKNITIDPNLGALDMHWYYRDNPIDSNDTSYEKGYVYAADEEKLINISYYYVSSILNNLSCKYYENGILIANDGYVLNNTVKIHLIDTRKYYGHSMNWSVNCSNITNEYISGSTVSFDRFPTFNYTYSSYNTTFNQYEQTTFNLSKYVYEPDFDSFGIEVFNNSNVYIQSGEYRIINGTNRSIFNCDFLQAAFNPYHTWFNESENNENMTIGKVYLVDNDDCVVEILNTNDTLNKWNNNWAQNIVYNNNTGLVTIVPKSSVYGYKTFAFSATNGTFRMIFNISLYINKSTNFYWNYTTSINQSLMFTKNDVNILHYFVSKERNNLSCSFYINNTLQNVVNVTNNTKTTQFINTSGILSWNISNWYFQCTDGIDNDTFGNASIIIDNTAPTVIISTIPTKTKNSTLNITINVTDNYDSNFSICRLSVNGQYQYLSNLVIDNKTKTIPINMTTQGNNTIQVICPDDLNNEGQANTTTLYDATSPTINVFHSTNLTTDTSFLFTFGASDTYDDNLSCSFLINNQLNATTYLDTNQTSYSQNITFTDGTYNWLFNCTDDVLNTGNQTGTVIFDNSNPRINNLSFVNNQLKNTNIVNGSFNVTDITYSRYSIITNNVQQSNITWSSEKQSFNISGLPTGNHNFSIIFYDYFGRQNQTSTYYFSIDLESPSITTPTLYDFEGNLTTTSISTPTDKTNITIVFTSSDAFTNISQIKVYYDYILVNITTSNNANQTTVNQTYNITTPGLHIFSIITNDSAGNINTTNIQFYSTSPLNVTQFIQNASTKPNMLSFDVFTNNTNISNNESQNVNQTYNFIANINFTTQTTINITGVDGRTVAWNNMFDVLNNDVTANQTVNNLGSIPTYILSIKNMSNFIGSSYNATITINKTITQGQYVYHCTDINCTKLNNTNSTSQIPRFYFDNSTNKTYVTVNSFSSIIISDDSFVTPANITSPNGSIITNGYIILNVSFGENVTGNYRMNNSGTLTEQISFVTTKTSDKYYFYSLLNTTGDRLNGLAYSNGLHILILNYTDSNGNNNITYYNTSFNFTEIPVVEVFPNNGNITSSKTYFDSARSFYFSANVPYNLTFTCSINGSGTCTNFDPYNYNIEYNAGKFKIYFSPSNKNTGGTATIAEGSTFIYRFNYCFLNGTCASLPLKYTHDVSTTDSDDPETQPTGAVITETSTGVNGSTQAKAVDNILTLLTDAENSINANASDSTVRTKLNTIYTKEKELQTSFSQSIEYIKDLKITNFTQIGINYADYTNAITKYEEINKLLSNANQETDIDTKFSLLNSVSTKQSIVMFNIPEVTKTNHFTSSITTLTISDLNNALSFTTIAKVKDSMKAINISQKNALQLNKVQDVYKVINGELSSTEMYKTIIKLTFTAKEELSNITIIETIPKTVANSSKSMVFLTTNQKILQDDPIISWSIPSLSKGETYSFDYIVNTKQTTFKTMTLFDAKIEPKKEITNNVSNTTQVQTTNTDNTVTNEEILSSNQTIKEDEKTQSNILSMPIVTPFVMTIIAVIILVLITLSIIAIKVSKKKKTSTQEKINASLEEKKKHDEEKQKQLSEFITKGLKDGMTIHEVKEALIKKGWPENIAQHAIDNLSMSNGKVIIEEDKKNEETKK